MADSTDTNAAPHLRLPALAAHGSADPRLADGHHSRRARKIVTGVGPLRFGRVQSLEDGHGIDGAPAGQRSACIRMRSASYSGVYDANVATCHRCLLTSRQRRPGNRSLVVRPFTPEWHLRPPSSRRVHVRPDAPRAAAVRTLDPHGTGHRVMCPKDSPSSAPEAGALLVPSFGPHRRAPRIAGSPAASVRCASRLNPNRAIRLLFRYSA